MKYELHKKSGTTGGEIQKAAYIIVKATHYDGETIDYRVFGMDWNPREITVTTTYEIHNPSNELTHDPYVTVVLTDPDDADSYVTDTAPLVGVYDNPADAETAMAGLEVIEGCRDPNATNFNSKANIEGSCTYPEDTEIPWGIIAIVATVIGIIAVV